MKKAVLPILMALMFNGCAATMYDAIHSKQDGIAVVYDIDESTAWKVSRIALRKIWGGVIEENRNEGYMVTEIHIPATILIEFKTFASVWINRLGDQKTEVLIIIKSGACCSRMRMREFHEVFVVALK